MNKSLSKKLQSLIDHNDYDRGKFVYRSKEEALTKKKNKVSTEKEPGFNAKDVVPGKTKSIIKPLQVDDIEEESEIVFIRTRN